MTPAHFLIAVEDDPFTRIIQLVLDPHAAPDRIRAFAEFFSHELPDFTGWLTSVRERAGRLYPARVVLVSNEDAMREALAESHAVVVESFHIGQRELDRAAQLRLIHKFGQITSCIDVDRCAARGIPVITIRRRANIACAEHALALMLALARRICDTNGLISETALRQAGYAPKLFDRRHTANSNWARISGLRTLHGATLGIVGLGEIGREIALRASAFGMRIVYTQRHRLDAADETRYCAAYRSLGDLLEESDFVSVNLPGNASTRGIIGQREFARFKAGAVLINVSRADVVDREALIDALRSGRIGGFGTDLPYEEPGRDDDPLRQFRSVIVTPHLAAQPRFNALDDLREVILNIAGALT